MFHANLVLFILIGVVCSTITSVQQDDLLVCGARAVWKLCTKCQRTCDSPDTLQCSRECMTGCQCKDKYVRDRLGNCIHPSYCYL